MTTTASTKVLGTAPEAFDGTASKAEGFLGALRNYYYLNESLYPDDSKRVASALTHFKVGTSAGEWARDHQDAAQKQTPIDYGSWADFLTAFKDHFIPVQSAQQAMNALWTVKMGNRPFHEWYQEWSTYAARSEANDATKMYAFRQALPQGLNDKLVGVTPAPTTLTDLVEKARSFDQQYQLYRQTTGNPSNPRRNQGARMRSSTTDDANVNLTNMSDSPRYQKLSEEEKAARKASNACFYCGKEGHFVRNCRSCPPRRRPPFKGQARTRVTETGEEAPSENKEEHTDTTTVSRIYHDPQYHFEIPEIAIDEVEDF